MSERVPFKGTWFINTVAAGTLAGDDFSTKLKSITIGPEKTKIEIGAFIGTNFKFEFLGSGSVPMSFTLQDLTQPQIKAFTDQHEAGTPMEFRYQSQAGAVIGSPTDDNMEWRVQFQFDKAPMLAGETDTLTEWAIEIMASAASLTDSGTTSPTIFGVFA